jgi:putative copper export protein/methionine-rich copper-binding protein CopC
MSSSWWTNSARPLAGACALLLLLPATPLSAHVVLRSSSPPTGAVVAEPPARIAVVFSGRVEQRFSQLALTAPDGSDVQLGPVLFADGVENEFAALVPPLHQPGSYTVQWRTAGADGHVMQGSFAFVFAPADTIVPGAVPPGDPGPPPQAVEPDAADTVSALLPVLGRWLHFGALTLIIGAVTFRVLLLPRLPVEAGLAATLRRRAWRCCGIGTLLLAASAILRLWLQSHALHGAAYAWDSALLASMLSETMWGRAWLLQAFGIAVLGAALLLARRGHDAPALGPALAGVIAVAVVPALSGHAIGADNPTLAVINDTLHVLVAGGWIGTLAVLAGAALPAAVGRSSTPHDDVATLIDRFSPIALGAAALVLVTGVLNALIHIDAIEQLVRTAYGRALLVKVGIVALVVAAGFINWQFVRPRLGTLEATRRLRVSIGVELALAVLVLGVTALLTGLPLP